MPVVLSFVNVKGGVGKTTSTMFLAKAFAGSHDVEVWDADPQGSATSWAEQAAELGNELPFPVDIVNRVALDRKLRQSTADFVLIDTPPGDPAMIDAAVMKADLVIIPTSPAVDDFQRMLLTAENIPPQVPKVALINRANKRSIIYREAVEFLENQDDIAMFSTAVGNRLSFQESFGTNPSVSFEYSFIADEILEAIS